MYHPAPERDSPVRVRIILAVTAAVFALTAGSASAAEGVFYYDYYGGDSALVDPASRECVNIPEVEGLPDHYAFGVRNGTSSTVTVFKDENCKGDYYTLKPHGNVTKDSLLVKSVVFS
jgi:hypothetical protein